MKMKIRTCVILFITVDFLKKVMNHSMACFTTERTNVLKIKINVCMNDSLNSAADEALHTLGIFLISFISELHPGDFY